MSKKNLIVFFVFIYLVTVALLIKDMAGTAVSGDNLTAMCLESSLPCMDIVADDDQKSEPAGNAVTTDSKDKAKTEEPVTKSTKKGKNGDPKVLIYHTHATESYLPSSQGNFHILQEENTVRDAGNVLEATLEDAGIAVIHDKTLHDNPSYDNSYTRSFETVKALLKKYPSIECIIDLHRDATPGTEAGPVQTVNGKTCAVYSYVISNTTETYSANSSFLGKLNGIAKHFDGYTGEILERPYWYNQELSGKSILIEMGNNRNNIKEVRNCAEVYGKILAKALKGS
ncbi:stage II sporulation protein P [uncultured Eubacterium sp.]|nr:stage II sporulation protein P [uncultured Eubacterium sp.]